MTLNRFAMFMAVTSVGLVSVSSGVRAEEPPRPLSHEKDLLSDWQFRVGVGMDFSPEYEGSDDYEVGFIPDVSVTWKDRVTLSSGGLTADVVQMENFTFGAGLGYDFGRKESDHSALRGLGKIEGSLQGIVYGSYTYEFVELSAQYNQDISDGNKGSTVDLAADVMLPLSEKWMVVAGPDLTWASGDYMQSRFGINGRQAAASAYRKYDAEAGIKDVGLHLNVGYAITEQVSLNTMFEYKKLLGDAADSPIVKSDNQMYGGVVLSYTF